MKTLLKLFLLLIFSLKLVAQPIQLTNDEKEWIKNHKTLTVHNEYNWPPFNFNRDNKPMGFSIDYMNLLAKKAGLKIKYKTGEWDELLNKAYNKQIDIMLNIVKNDERAKHLLYTKHYAKNPMNIIARIDDTSIWDMDSLNGKKVAVVKGFYDDKILKENYPKIKRVYVENFLEAIKAVIYRQADATLSKIVIANYIIKENMLIGLESKGEFKTSDEEDKKLNIAVRNDYPILRDILNKAMASVTNEEFKQIEQKWIFNNDSQLYLTKEEKKFLKTAPTIEYLYNHQYQPFIGTENIDSFTGIIPDILHIVSKKTGIKFKAKNINSLEGDIQSTNTCLYNNSFYSDVNNSKNIEKNIFSIPTVVIARKDNESLFLNIREELKDKKIALVKNSALTKYVKDACPYFHTVEFKTVQEALEAVSKEEVEFAICDIASAGYIIKTKNLENLKIATKLDYRLSLQFSLINSDPKIVSIFNKAFNSISPKEVNNIYQKWTHIQVKNKTDWNLVFKIVLVIAIVILLLTYYNQRLKKLVAKKTLDIEKQKEELKKLSQNLEAEVEQRTKDLNEERKFINAILNSQSNLVITTDGLHLQTANKAFLKFFNVHSIEEFKEVYGNCISDIFQIDGSNQYLHKRIKDQIWVDYIYQNKNHTHKIKIVKNQEEFIFSVTTDKFKFKNKHLNTAVFTDITELEKTKQEIEKILENILLPILVTSREDRKIIYANKYAEGLYEKSLDEIIGSDIDDVYTIEGNYYHVVDQIKKFGYVENSEESFVTNAGKKFTALLSVTPITYKGIDSYIGMVTDITKQKAMENQLRLMNKHTQDSIEYASLIQHALIPNNDLLGNYFKEYFAIWLPKDIVGGDIYLVEPLNNEECIIMVIDCTGHGVPGAFVTMLVKAIERQVVSIINNNSFVEVSPAWILSYFNKTMKILLKQDHKDAISNAGFDGGVLYYNKETNIIKFSGSETPLFYFDENGEFKIIKGDRHSIGYKKSDADYEFTEHTIEAKDGMEFFITTDGYIDQNGGNKGFPFGKKRFGNLLKEFKGESLQDKQEILLEELYLYQKEEERNDDITVVGVKI